MCTISLVRIRKLLKSPSYSQARLLEINSHSLFSRWFSESGKLVQRLFNSITELTEDEDTFVIVLIGASCRVEQHNEERRQLVSDEVESLTAARAGAMAGTEPSDALRVWLLRLAMYVKLIIHLCRW